MIFVRKKRLNPASVLKNNPKIDKAIKVTNTRFNTSSKGFTLKAQKRQDKNDIFLRNTVCFLSLFVFRCLFSVPAEIEMAKGQKNS